jgi:hypothetical protein
VQRRCLAADPTREGRLTGFDRRWRLLRARAWAEADLVAERVKGTNEVSGAAVFVDPLVAEVQPRSMKRALPPSSAATLEQPGQDHAGRP